MQIKVNRIIIDTNLWINFLITKDLSKLDELLISRQSVLVFSQELLDEFLEVAGRSKFTKYFSLEDIDDIFELIIDSADFVNVQTKVTICRDIKDNFLLSLSIDGSADYLLTADKDLLELKRFGETEISTISGFLMQE